MKTLEKVKEIIQSHKDNLRRDFHVREIGVFGSFSRGTQEEKSDLDILVDFEETVDLFEFIKLKDHLSDICGTSVDLVTIKALKPLIKDNILKQVVYV
jgi:predicted nucleotidyltransferase